MPPYLFGGDAATTNRKNAGYLRLARSLIRFCGMRFGEAAAFVCACAGEPPDFSLWRDAAPYATEVQLYKSLQALFLQMGGERAVYTEVGSHLRALLGDIAERFWRTYGMEITDSRTVFALCEPTLAPDTELVGCILGL